MSNRRRPRNPGKNIADAASAAGVDLDEDRLLAGYELVPRLGGESLELRFSDEGDPTVWMAIAGFGGRRFEVGAAANPEKALYRLLEQLVDGGQCRHCAKPTGITQDFDQQPAEQLICWYQYDPELKTYRRGCE